MKARVCAWAQITLPTKVRRQRGVREGDGVAFRSIRTVRTSCMGLRTIPADQAWFWTDGWQAGEREASEQIVDGKTSGPLSEAEFLAELVTD